MSWLADNMGNIVALLFVFAVVALALWGVFHGKAFDCSTCSGNCGGCGGACGNSKLKLSKEQEAQLDELTARYREEVSR